MLKCQEYLHSILRETWDSDLPQSPVVFEFMEVLLILRRGVQLVFLSYVQVSDISIAKELKAV